MTPDQLRDALARDGHAIADDLLDRAIDALAGPPNAEGLPELGFLTAPLQVAVLAALYRDYLEHMPERCERLAF